MDNTQQSSGNPVWDSAFPESLTQSAPQQPSLISGNPIWDTPSPADPSKNPDDIAAALKNTGSQAFDNYCQTFVEQMTNSGWKGSSAIDAWQNQQDVAKIGMKGIKPGDLVYFSPNQSNGYDGHTGIYTGNGQFVSATAGGVEPYSIKDWQDLTGQTVLGYIPQK